MIGGIISFVLFILGLFTKKAPAFDQGHDAGATEVQKSEAVDALTKVKQADAIRDSVGRDTADRLRDDAGNLYRD